MGVEKKKNRRSESKYEQSPIKGQMELRSSRTIPETKKKVAHSKPFNLSGSPGQVVRRQFAVNTNLLELCPLDFGIRVHNDYSSQYEGN